MQTRDVIITVVGALTLVGVIFVAGHSGNETATALAPDKRTDSKQGVFKTPGSTLGISVSLEFPKVVAHTRTGTAMIEVTTPAGEGLSEREPLALVLVADASGSMMGNKLKNAKAAMHDLIDRLEPGDSLSLVSFAEHARVELSHHTVDEVGNQRAHAAVDAIVVEGWTCVSCGIETAYQVLGGAPEGHQQRVLVLSDGETNRGVMDKASLAAMSGGALESSRIITSTIGIGRAIDAPLLSRMASSGAGGYYFLRNSVAIPEVIGAELAKAGPAAATDVVLRLMLPPGVSLDTSRAYLGERLRAGHIQLGRVGWNKSLRFLVPLAYTSSSLPPGPIAARIIYTDHEGRDKISKGSVRARMASSSEEVMASRDWSVSTESVSRQSSHLINRSLHELSTSNQDTARSLLVQARALVDTLEGHAEQKTVEVLRKGVDNILTRLVEFTPGSDALAGAKLLGHACESELSQGAGMKGAYHQPGLHHEYELE